MSNASAQLPQMPSMRLDGRRALVTGASSGIGLGCAVALAAAGAHVTLAARGQEALGRVAGQMREAGYTVETLALDISDLDAMQTALNERGPFAVLVNSAGMGIHRPALDTTVADYDKVMDLNLRAAYFLSVRIAEGMKAAGQGGSIINVSSQMAHVGGIDRAVYCASKHAVEGMTKAMAIEWGEHPIRINTICPTFIRTPMTEPTFSNPERVEWLMSKIKLGRVGEVGDIMGAINFLASDAAAMITGTSLLIDGGWTAG